MTSNSEWAPLVSIIMPTYNQGAYIQEAIDSVLAQSHTHLELIVVDNFSTDNTEQIIQSFNDERIHHLKFNNHGVIAAGRNHAVQNAKGEVLAFLDSDDVWLPGKLAFQLPHLREEEIVAVSTSFEPIGNTKACYHHLEHIPADGFKDYTYLDLVYSNPVMTSSLIINKKQFDQLHGFDESHEFRFIEDWELWLRVALYGQVRVIGAPLLQYRISQKRDRDLREVSINCLNIINKQFESGLISKKIVRQAKGNIYVNIGKAHLVIGDYSGMKYYIKGFLFSVGPITKLRALAGFFMYMLPKLLFAVVDGWLHSIFSVKRL